MLPSERDETIETVEYSDGFGRLLQKRAQAEEVIFGNPIFGGAILPTDQHAPPGDAVGQIVRDRVRPCVVVSGWQVYDNKGHVVEKYEPFFDIGWDYVPPTEEQFGQKATMFYDPRGQVIRTLNPDGSEQRVIYGVPITLDDPEQFRPTPWEAYTYDANDNVGRTHPDTALGYQNHWNTPANILVDALGRTIQTVERNGADPSDWFTTRSTYDIRGNLLTVSDALGRPNVFQYVYDLANHPLRIENIDAGIRRTVLDALGKPVEGRDSKGALALHTYDRLNRPIRLWARDDINSSVTLRERTEYGDDGDPAQPAGVRESNWQANRLGRLHRHHDETGLVSLDAYDFKGNLLEKARRVIGDAAILSVFDPPPPDWQVQTFRVDWKPSPGGKLADRENALLDAIDYRTSMAYDALNRVKAMLYPEDQDSERKMLRPHYNQAGALERVELDGVTYVEHSAYNAKGQRVLIAYGNSVMTRYTYDPRTFRLTRLCTERFTKSDPLTYRPTGSPLQDFAYEYDLVGNITAIHDRALGSGIPNTLLGLDALDRVFIYDPLYRLHSATGRECDLPPAPPPWEDQPRCTDLTRTRAYTEEYHYDKVGNLLQLGHAANAGSFTRDFTLVPDTNRLTTMTIGQTVVNYVYDLNGNLIREGDSRHFDWDHSNQMKTFRTQMGTSEPSVHAHYLYDAGGQRVKKLVRKQGGSFETTIYIDGLFEHHRWQNNGQPVRQNNHLHVMDDQQRIALVRVGTPHPDDRGPAVQFHLGDHLGSSNLVINQDGSFINREEYTPYGETSFGSFAKKRYRFTGKKRDEESRLYYHGARYYAPWLARWASSDPVGLIDRIFVQSNIGNTQMMLGVNGSQSNELDVRNSRSLQNRPNNNSALLSQNNPDLEEKMSTSLNLYAYVLDNPIKLVDPAGTQPKEDSGGIELAKNAVL
ncbi:MAG: RHS repeat domain-containing protein, partial [Ktedonobacteraceae bacterium]